MRRRRTPELVLVVCLACGPALACGAEPAGDRVTASRVAQPATVDDAVWEATLTEACTALNEEHSDLVGAEPTNVEEARRHASAVAEFTEAYGEVFAAVDDPDGDVAAGRALRQSAARFADAGAQLDAAARAGDADAAQRAVQRLVRLGATLDEQLEPWDVEPCRGVGDIELTTP